MARLMLNKWPGRYFKDQYIAVPDMATVYGYLSLADYDTGDEGEMMALDLNDAKPGTATAKVAEAIRAGRRPFSEPEEIQIGPGRYLIARVERTGGE
jgi:hypothetical protein